MTTWRKTVFPRPCATCGEEFQPFNPKQITCSKLCLKANPELADARRAKRRVMEHARRSQPEARERIIARNRVSNHPERRLAYLKSHLKQNYGMSYEQYLALLAAQNNRCAICGDPPKPDGKGAYSRLQVDHHHGSGKVRALLCAPCNKGIGHFNEDPERLVNALKYLTTHT